MRLHRSRSVVAAVALAITVGIAAPAGADPIDLADGPVFVVGNTVWDLYDEAPVTVRNVWVYDEGTDPTAPDAEDHLVNYGSNDMWWSAFLGEPDTTYYGQSLVWDVADQANGDIVVTGPVEQIMDLDVVGQFRFYADGDLVRMLVSYTNPTDEAITVVTGTSSYFAGGEDSAIAATSSGDDGVTVADRWLVAHDGGEGAPVLTMVWQGPSAGVPAEDVEVTVDGAQALATNQEVTVEPGETVRFAYFTAVTAYDVEAPPVGPTAAPVAPGSGLAETIVTDDLAAAVTAASDAASEFATFSGRLVAGLPVGTEVLNWGTVAAAPPATPATPVVTAPAFTG